MDTQTDLPSRRVLELLLGVLLATAAVAAGADGHTADAYYRNMLFDPGASVLKAEARGRVTIYDGMENHQVERALDRQFDRIDSMMFVRTKHALPDGSFETDDDCD